VRPHHLSFLLSLFVAGPDAKEISWYTCGPTVYDSAHMGHARNYVTGDILRRVLEDYFGYECFLVMNVTDVDDKIIKRARTKHLLADYLARHTDTAKVLSDTLQALTSAVTSQSSKLTQIGAQVEACKAQGGDNRKLQDLENAFAEQVMKSDKVNASLTTLQAMATPSAAVALDDILAIGGDVLAESLDAELGSTVSDPAIFRAHAAKYEQEFLEDMAALGVRPPDVMPRVSEYIPEIVAFIEKIVAQGMGYESNGSVYFSTQTFRGQGHVYGKLDPWAVGSSLLAAEGESNFETKEKRHATDFALWKAARPGEPVWESPWGLGRPGWHIECSAMASALIGDQMDIHSGGNDLRFPHHDNELAQSEAYFHDCGCQQWVNYFLHSGRLNIDGLKMSKSLKNFVTIREALTVFTARQLRLMFLLSPWEKPITYGESMLAEMKAKEATLKNFFGSVTAALRDYQNAATKDPTTTLARWEAEEVSLQKDLETCRTTVHKALLDNINLPGAMAGISELINRVNVYLASRQRSAATGGPLAQGLLLRRCGSYVTKILSVFGLVNLGGQGDVLGFGADEGDGPTGDSTAFDGLMDAFARFRDTVRQLSREKAPHGDLLGRCDQVRDEELVDLGIRLEDRSGELGAVWKRDNPTTLRMEIAEKKMAVQAAKVNKVKGAIDRKSKELEKYTALAVLPPVALALADKFRFDEQGNPTHDKDGNPLDDKALKNAKKVVDKELKTRMALTRVLEKEGDDYLERLAGEVKELEVQLRDMTCGGCE